MSNKRKATGLNIKSVPYNGNCDEYYKKIYLETRTDEARINSSNDEIDRCKDMANVSERLKMGM